MLKGLLGLKKPEAGFIRFANGFTPAHIGYLPQQDQVGDGFPATVKEVVQSGVLKNKPFHFFYTKEQKQRATEMMKLMEIEDLANASFGQLSGGQKQRALLVRAFGAARSMLILDEPVTGLDPVIAGGLYQSIARQNQQENITVVMVSHDVQKALAMATRILHLGETAYFFGSPEEYRASSVGQAFLGGVSSCG